MQEISGTADRDVRLERRLTQITNQIIRELKRTGRPIDPYRVRDELVRKTRESKKKDSKSLRTLSNGRSLPSIDQPAYYAARSFPARIVGAKAICGAGDRALSLKIALPRRLIKILPKGRIVWLMKMF
jgi:hypothetical protein